MTIGDAGGYRPGIGAATVAVPNEGTPAETGARRGGDNAPGGVTRVDRATGDVLSGRQRIASHLQPSGRSDGVSAAHTPVSVPTGGERESSRVDRGTGTPGPFSPLRMPDFGRRESPGLRSLPRPTPQIRCSDVVGPGEWAILIGDDLASARGVVFDAAGGAVTLASAVAAALLGRPVAPIMGQVTPIEQAAFDEITGEMAEGPVEDTIKALGYERAPGRCFVWRPDMFNPWRFRELK